MSNLSISCGFEKQHAKENVHAKIPFQREALGLYFLTTAHLFNLANKLYTEERCY